MPKFKENKSPAMKRTPYKMKGSPMQRNFGISPAKSVSHSPSGKNKERAEAHNALAATAEHHWYPHAGSAKFEKKKV